MSMKEVVSKIFTAKCGATPNHTRACMSSRQSCMIIKLSNFSGCFLAVQREGRLFLFRRVGDSCGFISNWTSFMPTLMLRRQMDVCINVVKIQYDIRNVYVSVYLMVTLVCIGTNFRVLGLGAVVPSCCVVDDWLRLSLNGEHDCKISCFSACRFKRDVARNTMYCLRNRRCVLPK